MTFKAGDRVVHPRHGVGEVVGMAIKEFVEGEKHPFYEISFPNSTLWVPLTLNTSGLRKLTVKSEIAHCRDLLRAPAEPLNEDPRLRQTDLSDHLKVGTLAAQCEVVRDLTAHSWHKPLSGSLAVFLRTTQDVLCQEWAAVEGVSLTEAASEIEALLEKSRQAVVDG